MVRSRRPGTQSWPLRRKDVNVRERAAGLMAPEHVAVCVCVVC